MLLEAAITSCSPEVLSSASNDAALATSGSDNVQVKAESKTSAAVPPSVPQFPPPKTDKPRPHQKLHYQNNPAARPKNSRRESTSGTSAAGGRVRKNSIANNNVGGTGGTGNTVTRPRANTLGHLDLASLGLMDNLPGSNSRINNMSMAQHRMSMNNTQRPSHLDIRGMQLGMTNHANIYGLPKLDTNTHSVDFNDGLRTAPPYSNGFGGFDIEQLFTPGGNTVNPAQLHFGGPMTSQPANLQQQQQFPVFGNGLDSIEQDDDFSWMRDWDAHMRGTASNENAIDESSPSRFSSSASQSGFSEAVVDASSASQAAWTSGDMSQALFTPGTLNLDALNNGLPNIEPPPGTISPQNLYDPMATGDPTFDAMMMQTRIPEQATGLQFSNFPPASLSNFGSDSPSLSSSSMAGSARQSSVTSVSTDSITDATRNALLASLSQPSVFGHTQRKFSQPSISSPLSPHVQGPSLPGTADLQRYINAYVQFFQPHLPFLHVPTLSFDSAESGANARNTSSQVPANHTGLSGGGGCLILAMAAIGALYEYDHKASKELFDAAKKMISLYLEERRRADMSAAVNGQFFSNEGSTHNTPLWLVQAMLLNVVYGHFSGDKTAADIASTHCAALVSLARAAELAQPPVEGAKGFKEEQHFDIKMEEDTPPFSGLHSHQAPNVHVRWVRWKEAEERKRTLFAVFILSSLLVTAYNQTPAIMNSEVLLDLPCEEDLWTADNAQEWQARGGAQAAEANALPFAHALGTLLAANQKQHHVYGYGGDSQVEAQLRPSTFGCLVLINALHNYIWETRSRHHGRQWTAQETESMFSHIEPALNAWQAAWKANDHHRLQRPNPFGLGPLSADSIPLLDLAFVHLFVNLGRSKEAFWQRDFHAMSDELAHGIEIVQHADGVPNAVSERSSSNSSGNSPGISQARRHSQAPSSGQSSKRERHLRKAAFYAADSLSIASKCNLTFADASSHELPIQSAMCFFACSQVLAEWACTVQERVGRYLGILGQTEIDYTQVPAIMLLETEDVELVGKIVNICTMLEEKMIQQANILARELGTLDPTGGIGLSPIDRLSQLAGSGLGSRMLKVTGFMLEKAAVWPVTHVMASALDEQAAYMNQRAEASLTAAA
ncbi:hypothetical protein MBLNU459_g8171t2 [Dothideomycetes sp. NU459]